jgi:RNA polymerase sigma-70 factor (ECF subfamily)
MTERKNLQILSDEDLMDSYVKDDSMAFEILYQRYAGQVVGYLTQKTRSPKSAQDLAQDVFLKLHRSRHQYNKMLPFAPWLFSIARSVFLDSAKKRSLEDVTEDQVFDKLAAPAMPVTESIPLDLSVLPENQKTVVSLRVYDEATFDEIAQRLSTTPENARQIFSRGIKTLKTTFGKRGNE